MSDYSFKKIDMNNFEEVKPLYKKAIEFMHSLGNTTQWTDDESFFDEIRFALNSGCSYKMTDRNGEIVCAFALFKGPDPMYGKIVRGSWIDDKPYYSIHKLASTFTTHGLFKEVLDFAFNFTDTIRIDTHKDNVPMKKAIIRNGFDYCGVVFAPDGTERVVFQKSKN